MGFKRVGGKLAGMFETLSVCWFRHDLRLQGQPALMASTTTGGPWIGLFVLPSPRDAIYLGAAARAWLGQSLLALDAQLRHVGSALVVLPGPPEEAFATLAASARSVQVHGLATEDVLQTSRWVRAQQAHPHLQWRLHGHAADHTLSSTSLSWQQFAPFWRAVAHAWRAPYVQPAPTTLPPPALPGLPPDAWGLAPRPAWDRRFYERTRPGALGARAQLEALVRQIAAYSLWREQLESPGGSGLSPHLAFGELDVREVIATVAAIAGPDHPFLRQLGWRAFARAWLAQHSWAVNHSFNGGEPGAPPDPDVQRAWQQEQTGIPLVDAAMRELWATGRMHRRKQDVSDPSCARVQSERFPGQAFRRCQDVRKTSGGIFQASHPRWCKRFRLDNHWFLAHDSRHGVCFRRAACIAWFRPAFRAGTKRV